MVTAHSTPQPDNSVEFDELNAEVGSVIQELIDNHASFIVPRVNFILQQMPKDLQKSIGVLGRLKKRVSGQTEEINVMPLIRENLRTSWNPKGVLLHPEAEYRLCLRD